ncbi:hypothetical protein [Frigoriglobus tundricola]|uniref:Uncharacterized protein n=1 Tax=Frigoriglobus tundricola TaxID=2774151 RepID=A0A6M5YLF3_9BACT|nr:hypothetical protein [Frigoriglobus tundricola]QJW94123.1 hypothetical protein FTUN_1642 [Frigoriglobus tundricola]
MATKPKETNVPLIFALVFFILTTIAFGVMWYLAFADIEQAKADKTKAEADTKKFKETARDAELKARVYRLWIGYEGEADDKSTIDAERAAGNVISTEVIKLNEALAKKLGGGELPAEFQFWKTDANKKADSPPAEGLADQIAKINRKYEETLKSADLKNKAYNEQIETMKAAAATLAGIQKTFSAEITRLPADFQAKLKGVTDGFDARTKLYETRENEANKKLSDLTAEKEAVEAKIRRTEQRIESLNELNQRLVEANTQRERGNVGFDEPQGKIVRRLPEGVVEINLGSAAGVRPGLTFTALPPDFPEKGRQSRMRALRQPDGKGGFKSVETFVPRGTIEVYEVIGPTQSLARVQPGSESDPIRDGVTVGDLIYNSAWRKGVADHIALIGIFDINGDGSDDIVSVVRDLTRMGIPVDAYYDMKKRAWVGEVTERTRYIVEGYMPINTGTDPNREEKTKLLGAINTAIGEGRQKGVGSINFRDFFSRMGYKFRLDVTDSKINQATAPYLSNVGVGAPATPPNP